MLTRCTLSAILHVMLTAAAGAQAQSRIDIAAASSLEPPNAIGSFMETQIAAHPVDPQVLMACTMLLSDSGFQTAAYRSRDAGRTWKRTLTVERAEFHSFDPSCAYGVDGTAYFTMFGWLGTPDGAYEALLHRSVDGGETWSGGVRLPVLDRAYITPDRANPRRLFIHGSGSTRLGDGTSVSALSVLRSDDGGGSVSPAMHLAMPQGTSLSGVGNGAMLADGNMLVPYRTIEEVPGSAARAAALRVVSVLGGGVRFGAPVRVDRWVWDTSWRTADVPSIAVDTSAGPFKGRIYLAWADSRSGASQILLSSSADGGKTWTRATTVNDEVTSPSEIMRHHFMPAVAVNRQGIVGLMWYDRRPTHSPDGLAWAVRFTTSVDGGESFGPSQSVPNATYDVRDLTSFPVFARTLGGGSAWSESAGGTLSVQFGADRYHWNGGDTSGIAARADGVFQLLWVDTRSGKVRPWTSTAAVTGTAVVNGSIALSTWTDVTTRSTIDVISAHYDQQRSVLAAVVAVKNTGTDPLRGRLHVRVLSVQSPLGEIGAVPGWDVDMPTQALAPGETSRPHALTLAFKGTASLPNPDAHLWAISPILTISAKVLQSPQ